MVRRRINHYVTIRNKKHNKSGFAWGSNVELRFVIQRHRKTPSRPSRTKCLQYPSPTVFQQRLITVRSGPVWRQDLAILSPEGPRTPANYDRERGTSGVFVGGGGRKHNLNASG